MLETGAFIAVIGSCCCLFLLLHHCEAADTDDGVGKVNGVMDIVEPVDSDEDAEEEGYEENEAILAVVMVVVAVATRELAVPIARRSSCCVVDIDACKLRIR